MTEIKVCIWLLSSRPRPLHTGPANFPVDVFTVSVMFHLQYRPSHYPVVKSSYTNLSRKKGIMTYCCLPLVLHELAFCGSASVFLPGLAYNIVGNRQCGSSGQQVTNTTPTGARMEHCHTFWYSAIYDVSRCTTCTAPIFRRRDANTFISGLFNSYKN